MWSETKPGVVPPKKAGRSLSHLFRDTRLHFFLSSVLLSCAPRDVLCSNSPTALTFGVGEGVLQALTPHNRREETYPIYPFRFLFVFCILGASPAKENSKESDFWKMLHEPENSPKKGRRHSIEVRASFLATSLRRLNMGFGSEGFTQAEVHYEMTSFYLGMQDHTQR